MNFYGILIGIITLLMIGIGHIIVIKAEFYYGKKCWPAFFIIGLSSLLLSFFVSSVLLSGTLGIVSFTFLWAIYELFEQEKRVERGWFPKNPERKRD
jgi:hypothetical protein